jgi:hypothetical protein
MKTDRTAYQSAIRIVLVVAFLLMIPLVAMQFTDQVVWTLADFVVAGTLLGGTGLLYELAARKASSNTAYRAAAAVALGTALFLVWSNLAVGIIGDEGNPANGMYLGVLAVGVTGAILAHFRPRGLARALFATALAQAVVAAIAIITGLGAPESGPLELVTVNGFFVVLWVGAAGLFRYAAREQRLTGEGRS